MQIPSDVGVKTLLHRTLGERKAHREFDKTKTACSPDEMVCAVVLPDGRPTYYRMPRSASDEALEAKAFEVYHGRPPEPGDVTLWRLARQHAAKAAAK